VSLVGAGPGDPGLLTLRALKRLREADVVYHDALVPRAILGLCRRATRVASAGRRRGRSGARFGAVVALLIRDARAGLRVVHLKGGDPFVFGRGGEEALALAAAGVPFEIVPGVTAGTAVPALAGIPVTHRGTAGSAAFVTAHDLSPHRGGPVRARLEHLARGADTIVVFMGGAEKARVEEALLAAGLPPGTPAAVIESGSLPAERRFVGTLSGLSRLGPADPEGPVLIVVGRTVALAAGLAATAARAAAAPRAVADRLAAAAPCGVPPTGRSG
jgi:uroporphyrin-III C-methyltransferase